MGYWQIGDSLTVESLLFCMEEDGTDNYLPTQCSGWYDAQLNVLANMFIYTTNCGEDDVLKMTQDDENGNGGGGPVIIVVVILIVICCSVGIWFYFKKLKDSRGTHGFQKTSRSDNRGSAASIELGDDVDTKTLVQGNGTTAAGQIGGFDMTPLNPNDDDDDDDDDDLSDDETTKGHGIVDDEEQLIGNTTKGDSVEPILEIPSN